MIALEEVKKSPVTTKTCAKVRCSSWAESYLEKEGFEAQKTVKQTIENSSWVETA